MYTAQLEGKGTFVIRYPRGRGSRTDWQQPMQELPVGRGRRLRDGKDVAVITLGPIGTEAARAIDGTGAAHSDLRFLKPLDEELLREVAERFPCILTVEDGCRIGGMGSAIVEWMSDHGYSPKIRRLGLPDNFVEHGSVSQLRQLVGLDAESIRREIEHLKEQGN